MRMARYQLTCKEKSTAGPVIHQTYDGEAQVVVREITTQTLLRMYARDISIYRHTLLLNDKPYDILNVFRLQ